MSSPLPFHTSQELDRWIKANCHKCAFFYDDDADEYCQYYEPIRRAFSVDGSGKITLREAYDIGYTSGATDWLCPHLQEGG